MRDQDHNKHFNLGALYVKLKRFPESIPEFKKAAKDTYYKDHSLHFLGLSYAATGQLPRAITALRKAVKLSPFHPYAYCTLAKVYRDQKKYHKG